ncbi:DUF2878 domain-containing protein [Salinimonas sediminis]|uniref:DUF2878 domain-containing protein n=1 Tax=Salinimonas sediminis TaxID=2303538 RepID=A0A346NLN9_9ALTE|nr:DUF2878 domain-containing protein [Salinimonas sediminis]AXR06446.1 DUF2878 domain-containing protein [Salinimonas sediminis]
MSINSVNKLVNFVWFQAIWILAIFTQYDYWWAMLILLAGYFVVTSKPIEDALCMVIVVTLGGITDSVLTLLNVFAFSSFTLLLPIPFWLLALWAGFALTLGNSLNYLQGRPVICAVLGALSGPLSYWAGERFHAVSFGYSLPGTLAVLALVWAALFPLCMYIDEHCRKAMQRKSLSNAH